MRCAAVAYLGTAACVRCARPLRYATTRRPALPMLIVSSAFSGYHGTKLESRDAGCPASRVRPAFRNRGQMALPIQVPARGSIVSPVQTKSCLLHLPVSLCRNSTRHRLGPSALMSLPSGVLLSLSTWRRGKAISAFQRPRDSAREIPERGTLFLNSNVQHPNSRQGRISPEKSIELASMAHAQRIGYRCRCRCRQHQHAFHYPYYTAPVSVKQKDTSNHSCRPVL